MKASELRIGNFITIDNEGYYPKLKNIPVKVSAIVPTMNSTEWTYYLHLEHVNQEPNMFAEEYSQLIKWVNPIQLTEELLLKWGFNYSRYNTHIVYSMRGFFDLIYYLDAEIFCFEKLKLNINHVHELQNLYFALKSKELEITL